MTYKTLNNLDINLGYNTKGLIMANHFLSDLFTVSQEAISFQKDEKFFIELTAIAEEVKSTVDRVYAEKARRKKEQDKNPDQTVIVAAPVSFDDVDDSVRTDYEDRFIECINRHTFMDITFQIESEPYVNAYIEFPKVTRGHPLVNEAWRWERELYKDGEAVVGRAKEFVNVGWVDLHKAQVHGVYRKINSRIAITEGIIKAMEPEEIAAVILHEVGHAFYYFTLIGHVVTRSFALAAISEAVLKTDDHERKVALLTRARKDMDLNTLDPDIASQVKSKEELQVVLINCDKQRIRSELGCDLYDMRGFEYLADNFAARCGASVALATGLKKLYAESNTTAFGTFRYIIFEILKVIGFIFMSVFTWGVWLICAILIGIIHNPMSDVYDDPKRRIVNIRQQLIEALKDKTNSKNRSIALLADIEIVDDTLKGMESRMTWFEFIFTNIVPSNKKEWNQLLLQKALEKLAYNDLFRVSSKLNTLFN